ncbi:hypothetical protein GCM10010345_74830 [Streptomyces canarius]|uniref:HNH endonuclease n=1 Tax=Streptomyces canarius TaxID=285453 RepID=A0ABQ3D6L7_9ACTN|nr:hypothetical protein GCM10010345_74830 [Streptomyces canarius]
MRSHITRHTRRRPRCDTDPVAGSAVAKDLWRACRQCRGYRDASEGTNHHDREEERPAQLREE